MRGQNVTQARLCVPQPALRLCSHRLRWPQMRSGPVLMRFGGSTVMLVLLLGAAPVLAQESPGIMPTVEQPAVKSKAAHVTPKRVAKPAAPAEAPKIAAPTTVAA